MAEVFGWLLDIFEGAQAGVVLWFVSSDAQRIRLRQDYPVTFYARGTMRDIARLEDYLRGQPIPMRIWHTRRKELYEHAPVEVLAVELQPNKVFGLFRQVLKQGHPMANGAHPRGPALHVTVLGLSPFIQGRGQCTVSPWRIQSFSCPGVHTPVSLWLSVDRGFNPTILDAWTGPNYRQLFGKMT